MRQSALHRLLASLVLAGMTLWVGAPLAAAHPQGAAAQAARAHAGGPLEAAVAEALAAASRADDATATFVSAMEAALEAHPDGGALAEILRHAGPSDLLDLLVGHLLRGTASATPLIAVAAPAPMAPSAAAGIAAVDVERCCYAPHLSGPILPAGVGPAFDTIREHSEAQPRGP